MKLILCTPLLLCGLLVIGSLDSLADPPAVNPHAVNLKAPCLRDSIGTVYELCWDSNPLGASSRLRIRFLAVTNDRKPSRPSGWIVVTGQASDPSPPEA